MIVSTDGNGTTNRVLLFAFRKAFDLINHYILLENYSRMISQDTWCVGY